MSSQPKLILFLPDIPVPTTPRPDSPLHEPQELRRRVRKLSILKSLSRLEEAGVRVERVHARVVRGDLAHPVGGVAVCVHVERRVSVPAHVGKNFRRAPYLRPAPIKTRPTSRTKSCYSVSAEVRCRERKLTCVPYKAPSATRTSWRESSPLVAGVVVIHRPVETLKTPVVGGDPRLRPCPHPTAEYKALWPAWPMLFFGARGVLVQARAGEGSAGRASRCDE